MQRNDYRAVFPPTLPLRMEPCPVWRTYLGGSLLAKWRGLPPQPDGHFPEDWLGSTTRAHNPGREELTEGYSVLSSPQGSSRQTVTLRDLLESAPESYLGENHARHFGAQTAVLVKLLHSAIRLPIQAHPDRQAALRYWGSPFGKTESWYVLDTQPGEASPYVLLGFRPGVTRNLWLDAYRRQDIKAMRGMLHRVPVQKGEMYLVKPGVPHAIGEGCLLVETQEPSDLVFRVEKQNAAGQLLSDELCTMGIGVDAMMDLFCYQALPAEQNRAHYQVQPRLLAISAAGRVELLLGSPQTDCFSVQRLAASMPLVWQPDCFSVILITAGRGRLTCAAGTVPVRAGETWFLPAGVRGLCWEPVEPLEALLCCPPTGKGEI